MSKNYKDIQTISWPNGPNLIIVIVHSFFPLQVDLAQVFHCISSLRQLSSMTIEIYLQVTQELGSLLLLGITVTQLTQTQLFELTWP
jgi:hypothetical protein